MGQLEHISLRGVRQNNLRGFDLDIPLGQLTVVTGLSGAGKSSLVFDTLHAEGQRRYVETFSPYVRQFLEMLDRPKVDSIVNIRPSIAIQQTNAVRTSRSTVGTMTELCDYFKVWFCHRAELFDPVTGQRIDNDHPASIFAKALTQFAGREILVTFPVARPASFSWSEIFAHLRSQGFTRLAVAGNLYRLEDATNLAPPEGQETLVVQDRLTMETGAQARFLESAASALHFGQGRLVVTTPEGAVLCRYSAGLHSSDGRRAFRPATPGLFSFNSPLGACPRCRGFGRIIEIDYRLVIPDRRLSIGEGAIRAFQGTIYSESQKDLLRACRERGISTGLPFEKLPPEDLQFVLEGDPQYGQSDHQWPQAWYGVKRFFEWLETNTYKMHVRVFLSKYRAYIPCPDCGGSRLQSEALNWRWRGRTLPDLYRLSVAELLPLIASATEPASAPGLEADLAASAIATRLRYLDQVGLGYLSLDRASRTLSGGESMRVSLTTCLGTALVDTLFVLDEPSIGLHSRDISRLISILRRLTLQGNTVVVVEHDEAIMRAADHIVEIGPLPGTGGGRVVFAGSPGQLIEASAPDPQAPRDGPVQFPTVTGRYLAGLVPPVVPGRLRTDPRHDSSHPWLLMEGIHCHNLQDLGVRIPLRRLVVLSGVSGAGKSTLLDNAIFQGLMAQAGRAVEEPAAIRSIETGLGFAEIVLVDQSPVSRTPRSNAAVFVEAWDAIRELLARTDEARAAGLTTSSFSFNSGAGRCPACEGLGYERVEMQFMADVYVTCPVCEGRRFRPEALTIRWNGCHAAAILEKTVSEALDFFREELKIRSRLVALEAVGLGYLPLGQPLNTLSGGESQRLKLVKYLSRFGTHPGHALILLDEPTTGLHRQDVGRLITALDRLVEEGHSLVVIEHHLDILAAADWIVEMGPEAGQGGGRIVFAGPPAELALVDTATAPYLREVWPSMPDPLHPHGADHSPVGKEKTVGKRSARPRPFVQSTDSGMVAEDALPYHVGDSQGAVVVAGAREHNLKNIAVRIPHHALTVLTGVSGSGKSSLAFDIIFAEGQRRFLESMSAWARQYVEQLPKAEVDHLSGIPPTVAIEQRITAGTGKSTVATITEVAQYLRLLYARTGLQHSPVTGQPVVAQTPEELWRRCQELIGPAAAPSATLHLCAPLVRGRKGHHQPLARRMASQGIDLLRVDGAFVPSADFEKLDRFKEHDIEAVIRTVIPSAQPSSKRRRSRKTIPTEASSAAGELTFADLTQALRMGQGTAFLARQDGAVAAWLSTSRSDPLTGESYPDLDPKHFSWNSTRGWCPLCHGHGRLRHWMREDESYQLLENSFEDGLLCPQCQGARLNPVSRAVRLPVQGWPSLSLPELLALTPGEVLDTLNRLDLDKRGQAIAAAIVPEVAQRLRFMDQVGLAYLALDRSTDTLSGGETQRIRLAAQLGSNLSGVLYVLDEPSIGLHARDNERLLDSLCALRDKGNTVLVVEHDEEAMRRADYLIDLGPGAGRHGGQVLFAGPPNPPPGSPGTQATNGSLTLRYLAGQGLAHPLRGSHRPVTRPSGTRPPQSKRSAPADDWMRLEGAAWRNLKGFDLDLPLGRLIVMAGVSGAGKSTLLRDLLKPAVQCAIEKRNPTLDGQTVRHLWKEDLATGQRPDRLPFRRLLNGHRFAKVIEVDQEPIGKTPRSTPATYIGIFDHIRKFYAGLPEARILGLTAGAFSFNTEGGRCPKCAGAGRIKLEMSFMPDTYVPCEECGGGRYDPSLREIRWRGRNIGELLQLSFEDALPLFDFHGRLKEMAGLMVETGLGYLTLGQSSPTLSGGEAQRLKLVSELAAGLPSMESRARGVFQPNLYLLEEPTIGLHLSDCERLLGLLHRLVDQGHTVMVIEHHLDIIAEADWVVEIGPEGGMQGGELLYAGPVAGLAQTPRSPTAKYLEEKINRRASNTVRKRAGVVCPVRQRINIASP